MNDNLKTCPLCGGAAEIKHDIRMHSFWVSCTECTCTVGALYGQSEEYGAFDTKGEAVEAWNCRGPRETSISQIFQRIAADNGITLSQLKSAARPRHIAWPRQYGMLLCKRAGATYEQIGQYLNREHCTIMHGVKAAQKREDEK